MATKKLIYLASPYTHDDPAMIAERVIHAQEATAKLIEQGHLVFSPIVSSHPIVDLVSFSSLNSTEALSPWMDFDKAMIEKCDEVWVLMLEGWKRSLGVAEEIAHACALGIPVVYVNAKTLEPVARMCGTLEGEGEGGRGLSLPEDCAERNAMPMADGLLYYFPNALAEVSKISKFGNDQHNPGQEIHWSRGKSTDHANKIVRHLVDAGKKDKHGNRHSAFVAWRALALLQEELERDLGLPLPQRCWVDAK